MNHSDLSMPLLPGIFAPAPLPPDRQRVRRGAQRHPHTPGRHTQPQCMALQAVVNDRIAPGTPGMAHAPPFLPLSRLTTSPSLGITIGALPRV